MKSEKDLKLGFKLLTLVSSGNGHYIFNSLLHRTISCTKMNNKTKSIIHTRTKIQKKKLRDLSERSSTGISGEMAEVEERSGGVRGNEGSGVYGGGSGGGGGGGGGG